jgi:DnaJ-class molecular chaperone
MTKIKREYTAKCYRCEGTGFVDTIQCNVCEGTGIYKETSTIFIDENTKIAIDKD